MATILQDSFSDAWHSQQSSSGSHYDQAIGTLVRKMPRTQSLFAHDRQMSRLIDFSSPVPSLPFALGFERADKAQLWDFDGNAYIDFSMGLGSYLLGHQPKPLTNAALETLESGAPRLSPSPLALPLAEKLAAAMPIMEQVLFVPSAAQAFVAVLRMARTLSGKMDIALACGEDWTPPLPPSVVEPALQLSYCDPDAITNLVREKDRLALVVLSPFDPAQPDDQGAVRDWLHHIEETCRDNGILIVLDERLSGLRLALGGAQERYGLKPDLVILGNTLAPGLPLAAVGGGHELMKQIRRRQTLMPMYRQEHAPLGQTADLALPIAVAHAHVQTLQAAAGKLYPALEEEALRLQQLINDFTDANQIPISLRRAASVLRFTAAPALLEELTVHLLIRGIYWPADQLAFLSGAHTPDHIDSAVIAIQQSLLNMRADGKF